MSNKENIKLWVDGLRSGRFTQGKGYLKQRVSSDEYYYCCLGVACEIAKEHGIYLNETDDDGVVRFEDRGTKTSGVLPHEVKEWLGLNDVDPLISVKRGKCGHEMTAICANDDEKLNFDKIAKLIEIRYLNND